MTLSDEFQHAVREHLVLSYLELETHPVILGIFGRPGEGKTYQLRTALDRCDVEQFSINAADLESDRAGLPGRTLLETYLTASRAIERGRPGCLVIDDVDTTVGEWEENTGTVNHQQVLAQLMHLADRPCEIEKIGRVRRVPVFFTGNDFGKLYRPLRRPGRMTLLYWAPSRAEKTAIVGGILAAFVSTAQSAELVKQYAHRPVSFFADLRGHLVRHRSAPLVKAFADELPDVVCRPAQHRARLLGLASRKTDDKVVAQLAKELDYQHTVAERSYLGATVRAPAGRG
jgi:hypothetical protein